MFSYDITYVLISMVSVTVTLAILNAAKFMFNYKIHLDSYFQ